MAERVLAYDRIIEGSGSPERWLFILHGIYGAGRNWASIARRVVRERPEWGAILVDLREHGGSRGFAPPHTLSAAAGDLAALATHLGVSTDAVLGHSFGGKVALTYLADHPDRVRQLWIADSTPEARPPIGAAVEMLSIVRRVRGPFASRTEAIGALEAEGVATGVAQWMSSNLESGEGGFVWRLDFDVMEELLDDFFRTDRWDVVESPPAGVEIHFLRATRSSVLSDEAADRIAAAAERTGRVHLHEVEGGHWLNADNPDALVALLTTRLP